MDISILSADTKFGSPHQLKFVKNASIKDLCDRHLNNRHHRNTQLMATSINCLEDILNQLEEQNIVYSYFDASLNWKTFYPTDKTIDNDQVKLRNDADLRHKLLIANKYRNTLNSAIERGIDFDLSLEDIEELLNAKHCFYTNVPFDSEENAITFDRINHNKGYVRGNVVPCTAQANALKNKLYEHTSSLFPDIKSLKHFVDTIFVSSIEDKDPLSVFLLEESA